MEEDITVTAFKIDGKRQSTNIQLQLYSVFPIIFFDESSMYKYINWNYWYYLLVGKINMIIGLIL